MDGGVIPRGGVAWGVWASLIRGPVGRISPRMAVGSIGKNVSPDPRGWALWLSIVRYAVGPWMLEAMTQGVGASRGRFQILVFFSTPDIDSISPILK